MQSGVEDKVLWNGQKNGPFSVKSLFKVLEPAPLVYFPANTIWHPKLKPRICFFTWEAA